MDHAVSSAVSHAVSRTMKIYLAGMRHLHYASSVELGFADMLGQEVTLRLEDDNAFDPGMAVAAYFDYEKLAYVTSNACKKRVRRELHAQGRQQLYATIRRFVKARTHGESDMLEVEFTPAHTHPERDETSADQPPLLWHWDGPVLPTCREAHQLHAVVEEVTDRLRQPEPSLQPVMRGIAKIAQLSWADISGPMSQAYSELLSLLTMATDHGLDTTQAILSMQQIISHVGSPEVRQQVFDHMLTQAQSPEVGQIVTSHHYTLEALQQSIPQPWLRMAASDPHGLIGCLWYLELPLPVARQAQSVITYLMRLLYDHKQAQLHAATVAPIASASGTATKKVSRRVKEVYTYRWLNDADGRCRLIQLYQALTHENLRWLDPSVTPDDWCSLFMGKPKSVTLKWLGSQMQLKHLFRLLLDGGQLTHSTSVGRWEILGSHFVNQQSKPFTTDWHRVSTPTRGAKVIEQLVEILNLGKS